MPSPPLLPHDPDSSAPSSLLPVAAYVRTSTNHQPNSLATQLASIQEYAAAHEMRVARVFMDEGKSGLDMDGRSGLQELLRTAQSGVADFRAILVLDVTRWGRFQNPDESAYYEHLCRRAGIEVIYCAEPFQNDDSPMAAMIRNLKRTMAGESSRELSNKVFAGQCRLVKLGYRQGGPPGFGLRRVMVDCNREPKAILAPGEYKSLQTDRVILTPGPPEEIALVRKIYQDFVKAGMSEADIASALNARGSCTDQGRPWTRGTVHQVLTNEKYIGNNVYNRTSSRLHQRSRRNPQDDWIRCDGAFPEIVSPSVFHEARRIINERSRRLSDSEMLGRLHTLLDRTGFLSGIVIDEQDDMPSSSSYEKRFGGLLRAYQLIGYAPERDYRFVAINRALRAWRPQVAASIATRLRQTTAWIEHDEPTGIITINGEWTISVIIARCLRTSPYRSKWKLRFDSLCHADLIVAVRMDEHNEMARDYYIFPKIDFDVWPSQLAERNAPLIDSYRFDTLQILEDLAKRTYIKEAA